MSECGRAHKPTRSSGVGLRKCSVGCPQPNVTSVLRTESDERSSSSD